MDWVVNELRVAIENDLQLPDSEPVRSHFLNSMCSYLVMNIRSRSKNDKFLVSWNVVQWLLLLKNNLILIILISRSQYFVKRLI